MGEPYTVSEWFSSPGADVSCGRALVLPGGGYTVDHPVLFWSCQVLAQVGWRVVTMRWQADGIGEGEARRFVEDGADVLDAQAGSEHPTLVLAKSLGSYAAAWASARGYPAIWLTPVLTDAFVAQSLASYSAPSLLVGGTSDPMWFRPAFSPPEQALLELPEADHALHVGNDWARSLQVLRETLRSIENFASRPV